MPTANCQPGFLSVERVSHASIVCKPAEMMKEPVMVRPSNGSVMYGKHTGSRPCLDAAVGNRLEKSSSGENSFIDLTCHGLYLAALPLLTHGCFLLLLLL